MVGFGLFGLRDWEMPDNSGHSKLGALNAAKVALLVAMLIVPAVLVAVPVIQAQTTYSAWLKLVTTSWNGQPCIAGGTPACVGATTGFADRYNLTANWYWVEVYHEKRGAPFNDVVFAGKFYPNGTGFVLISWPVDWPNVTVVVKAKSYDGTEIGAGTLYDGIIVYMLVINPTDVYLNAKTGSGWGGFYSRIIDMTGTITSYPFYRPTAAGPVNFVRIWPKSFAGNHSHPTAADAWVANSSVIFKPFHVHTWYSVLDNLSYAQVKIYDINHTAADSSASLLRAFVTKGDGSGNSLYDPRTTGEMFPVYGTRWRDNELVPIPLQAINLNAKRPYSQNLPRGGVTTYAHLNATVRVWWESVLVNTTFYVGPDLAQPNQLVTVNSGPPPVVYPGNDFQSAQLPTMQSLSIYYNHTTPVNPAARLYDYLNATVFYWRCGARDDDLLVNGTDTSIGWVGSALFDAQCIVNLRDKNSNVYHTLHERGSTGQRWEVSSTQLTDYYALSDDPHDWSGYLSAFRGYLRAPNATMWTGLYTKFAGVTIDGTSAAGLIYVSKYYSGTADLTQDPSLVAVNDYLKTRSIADDPGPYRGIRLEVQYAGGYKNLYGGLKQTVGVYTLQNIYLIALKDTTPAPGWVDPFATAISGNYPEILTPSPLRQIRLGTSENGGPIAGIVDSNTVENVPNPPGSDRTFERDGKLLVVANASDIVFAVYDNQGSLLTPPQTDIWLLRENGVPVQLAWYRFYDTPSAGIARYVRESEFVPFLQFINVSTSLFSGPPPSHIAVAYQVPENLMYGVIVKFEGVSVYQNEGEIPKLIKTVYKQLTVSVFKLKVVFVDCQDRPLTNTPAWVIDPILGTEVRFNTGPDGARDFIVPADSITFTRLYWKGVDVPLLEAILPNGTKIQAEGGKVTIPATADIYAPIKIKVLVDDFVFKTWDFQGTTAIPRLNITIWWTGYNISDPTKSPWTFLETMDPRGYGVSDDTLAQRLGDPRIELPFDADRWNTSVRVAQFFAYVIFYDNRTNEYTFYQMPPAIYNIIVTTVVPIPGFSASASPGVGFWPGETQDRAYESVIVWKPGAESVTPEEVHEGAKTRVVLREFNKDLRYTSCGVQNVDLKTWALHWFLEMIDSDLPIGDVRFDIVNDNFLSMTLDLGNSTKWDKLTLEYKTIIYGTNKRGPQDYSYIWWNGSYRLEDVRLVTNMSFTVDKFYNATAPNKVWPTLNFTLQPNAELHAQQALYSDWLDLQEDFGYKIIIYDKETLRAPLPVTLIKPRAIDKGGAPLENALIELWILDVNKASKIDITDPDGDDTITVWDTTYTEGQCRVSPHTVSISWVWETKRVADRDTPQHFEEVTWDRLNLTIDGDKMFLQVPPYPAKLYLRDIGVGDDDNFVVTAKEIYWLVDNEGCPIDNNDEDEGGADTPMTYDDGLLKYARWKTQADGTIKSFTIPGYEGLLLVPTSGWLNETFSAEGATGVDLEEEFHYQFNVVWKSAVVYSDNFVLDKGPVIEFGASEVYDVRFMFTLSNSTNPADAVRNLNLWIYYPNVTTWHEAKLWSKPIPPPQDYAACEESYFTCDLRVTLISSADADGVVEFSKIPGPRFMNTTWKYVFSANHSAITWLTDLVATQFVLNNETFGDGPLKKVTKSGIDVPIMLNAAHQLQFLVLGWRDEQGIPTAYPLEGFNVKYEIRNLEAKITAASGTAVSDTNGLATVASDPRDPTKVLWAGLTVRYRVEPPSWLINVNDARWSQLLGARGVEVVSYTGYTPDPRPSVGAYFPDEVPTHWAITTISTWFSEDGYCFGLCTAYFPEEGRTRSKPYIINVDYTIVTVRALDFNGRPLRGAFVEIVERASGRVAGWSYTFGSTWTRQPIDLQQLYDYHRVSLLPARIVGGDGYTEFIPVAVGPWNYDANNDDKIDVRGEWKEGARGDDPRTSDREGTALAYIVRVYWAATDPSPDNANGDLRAIWPFIDPQKPFTTTEAGQSVRKYHVKVYDSDFDETDEAAKTLIVPIDTSVEVRKPSDEIFKYDGKHRDVTTAVFDLKLLLNYEGKTLPDSIKNSIEVWVFRKTGAVTELALRFRGGPTIDTVTVNRLPRGVYEARVVFVPTGATIFTRTFDISVVNVGTVQAEASLPFTDLSFEVTDLRGRPLPISEGGVTVEPTQLYSRVSVAGNVVTITALYTGAPVTVTVKYSSPVYGTTADTRITDSAEGFRTRLLGGRTLQLPVDDVTVTVVDRQGRPMGGAVVKLGQAPAKSTGGDGKAVFESVPLESAGRGITYSLSVTVGGVEVTPADARSVELSTARTSITVIGELFSLPVRVIGQLGQGLEGANVRVVKGAVTVASSSTDQGGFAQFDRLVLDTYTVVANYKGYSQEVTVSSADLQAGRVVEITLPIYTELLGIPMPLSTLLALIIGLILLVVVLAIIVSEYRWWRGRRLGVYPPAPPKAPK